MGLSLLGQDRPGLARRRFKPHYPFALTARKSALSSAIAPPMGGGLIDERLDFAFVFEDDAEIDADQLSALLQFVIAEWAAWDYVLLPAKPIRKGAAVARGGALALLRPDAPPLRAIGQIVARRGRAPP